MGQSVRAEYDSLVRSFERQLRCQLKAPKTLDAYLSSARFFGEWLAGEDHPVPASTPADRKRLANLGYTPVESSDSMMMAPPPTSRPTTIAELATVHVQSWILTLVAAGLEPSTVSYRYRGVQQFIKFLVEEGELDHSPMSRLKPPKVTVKPVATVGTDDLKKLLATCRGREFAEVRDDAIIRLYIDSGGRLKEVAGLAVSDLDMRQDVAQVIGKGGKPRALPFGNRTASSIERYLRARSKHKLARLPELWLPIKDRGRALTSDGIHNMIQRRCAEAGIDPIHAHQFRHTMATDFLDNGGSPNDLMRLMGWDSHQMIKRYTDTTADRRAREAHRRMSLGDRLR